MFEKEDEETKTVQGSFQNEKKREQKRTAKKKSRTTATKTA